MNLGLRGKVALVTGAGGLLGGPMSRTLADEGCRVIVHHRDESDRAAAEEVARETGGLLCRSELTDPDAIAAMFDRAERELGPVYACVANAGRFPRNDAAPLWEIEPGRWRQTVEDNLTASFLTAREWARRAVPAGQGSLVLLTSAAGLFGQPDHADYSSSKAAIAFGMLRTLKNELGRVGPELRVNAVAPAWTVPPDASDLPAPAVAATVATQALGRLGTTEDVARAVAWLASPIASAHVTGEVIRVTGGMEGRIVHPPTSNDREGDRG